MHLLDSMYEDLLGFPRPKQAEDQTTEERQATQLAYLEKLK